MLIIDKSSPLVIYSAVDFFKELPHFILKVGPILSNFYGVDWEKRLEVLDIVIHFVIMLCPARILYAFISCVFPWSLYF